MFLLSFFASVMNAQNSTLTVNINDQCNLPINTNVTTKLYWHSGPNTIFIKETNQNPAIFENLVSSYNYTVNTSIEQPTHYNFSIKDQILMQRHILGLSLLNPKAQWAGDTNQDGKLTASDISEMTKAQLNISDNIAKEYFLLPSNMPINFTEVDMGNIYINGILNGNQTLNVYAGRKGNVAGAMTEYCDGKCPDITDRIAQVLFDDINITKGTEISIPIYYSSAEKYIGMNFTMGIKNATLIDVRHESGTVYKIDQEGSIKAIVLNQNFNNSNNSTNVIYTLTLKPEINGKLSDLIFIKKDNTVNEAILEKDECIVSIRKMELKAKPVVIEDCVISWPESIIIANCDDLTGEPEINPICKNYYFLSFMDQKLGECNTTIRTWKGINWLTGKIEDYIQVIKIRDTFVHQCSKNHIVNLKDGFKFVAARNLVIDPDPSHFYSYSSAEIGDSVRLFKYESPFVEQYKIYDITDSVFCIAKIEKTIFDPTVLNVINRIEVTYSIGYQIKAINFTQSHILPSGISDLKISYNGGEYAQSIDFNDSFAGQSVILSLKYKVNGQDYYYGNVEAYLKPKTILVEHDPLRLYAYNDYLIAGQPYEMEFYSSNFNNILSFQFGLKLNNLKFSNAKNGSILLNNGYAYFPNKNEIRMAWYDQAVVSNTFDANTVLFKFILLPDVSGFLKDFISIDPSIMNTEASYNDLNVTGKILLEIDFPNRTYSNVSDIEQNNFEIFPNPVLGDYIKINWKSLQRPLSLNINDMLGKTVRREIFNGDTQDIFLLPIHTLSAGNYIVSIQTQNGLFSEKIVILK